MIEPVTGDQMVMDYAKALRKFPKPKRPTSPKNYARQFAKRRGIPLTDFFGKTRAWEVAHPRQECMAKLRLEHGFCYHAIARALKRDHTTVMHGVEAAMRRGLG